LSFRINDICSIVTFVSALIVFSLSDKSSLSDRIQEDDLPFMSSMARKRLRELRKVDPSKVDVATGLQWIRLELVSFNPHKRKRTIV